MFAGCLKTSGVLSAVTLILALFYQRYKYADLSTEIPNILDSLQKAEKQVEVASSAKVAIGFGGCMDVFVNAIPLLNLMDFKLPKHSKHHKLLQNKKDLSQGFLYFFEHGAAAERYMNNKTLFTSMVQSAKQIKGVRIELGGNAPVMANRFAREGAEVLLAAQSSPDFKKVLSSGIKMAGNAVPQSDVHLILEYKTGEAWQSVVSPRANRYIVHSDEYNPTLQSLEAFIEEYKKFKASLLVVGGLQMMDNYPFRSGEREARLQMLESLLIDSSSKKTLTHFELASFVDEDLLSDLLQRVLPYSDSIGMNEQELPNLLSFAKFGNITMISESYPRVATVLDQLRDVYQLLRKKHNHLSRLHVHTLAFQAILTKKGSKWKNTMSAAAHASLTANRHICGKAEVDIATSKLLLDESFSTTTDKQNANRISFDPKRAVSCWEEDYGGGEVVLICVAPNLVCTKVHQTAGGGDNISSAGLAFQI